MKKYIFYTLFAATSCFGDSPDTEEHISVADEAFPKLPTPSTYQEDHVLIKSLKGIVILEDERALLSKDDLEKIQGVEFIDINIPGNPPRLKRSLREYLGKAVTESTAQEMSSVISDYFESVHHPLVLVGIPTQEFDLGVLQFRILESRLGEVKVEGNRWTNSQKLKEYIHLRTDQEIDESRLLQNVSFINKNPFRRADVIYAPGEKEGTTDVILSIKDRRPLRFYAGVENTGVEPVGRGRWYTGFNWGNAFWLDHILSYQFTSAFNMHRFKAHTVQYTAPLSWGHIFEVYGGYSEVHPKVHRPIRRNNGWSMQTSGCYTVPLPISRFLEHEASIGFDFKRTNNTFEFTEDLPLFGNNVNLTQFVFGYTGNYERNTYRLDFNGDVYWSPGDMVADQTNEAYSTLRPGAKNHWVYFRCSFVYLQRLPKSFSFSLLARGQVSSNPLLPSEQFGLGGYDTVRGYDQREVNKDDAILLSAEARSPALPILKHFKPQWKLTDALQFLVFLDYGWGINIDTLPGYDKADYLLGTGPGVRYTLEPYLAMRLDWGIRLHDESEFGGGRTMVHFNVTASY